MSPSPWSYQACLPLDLIPSLATLKTTNGTNLVQTHAPTAHKLTPADALRRESRSRAAGVWLLPTSGQTSRPWSQAGRRAGGAAPHSPVVFTERDAATSSRWCASSGLSLMMTELMLSFSIQTYLEAELLGEAAPA